MRSDNNLLPPIVEASAFYATEGEIPGRLLDKLGDPVRGDRSLTVAAL